MSNKFISLFSGIGGSAFGAKAAGYEVIGAVEWDKEIGDLYYRNHQSLVLFQDVKDIDPRTFPGIKEEHTLTVQISPPCQEYSQANCYSDLASDRATALDNCYHILDYLEPDRIVVENVRGFQKSKPMDRFRDWLSENDYKFVEQVINCADTGVPQTRVRYFSMAVKIGSPLKTLDLEFSKTDKNLHSWTGWYEAIKDLIPEMSLTSLSPKQLKAIEGLDKQSPLLIPTFGYYGDLPPVYQKDRPSLTVKAMMMSDKGRSRKGCWRIADQGKVYEMSTRGLARLQAFPDDLVLSGENGLDCKAIGNAVPPLVMQKILENCF